MLRIVVRNGFSHDLADLLIADLARLLPELNNQPAPGHKLGVEVKEGFRH